MDEADDLSNGHPAHWPEARRRIGVLKQYVALEKPTTQDLARHADELSMSTEQLVDCSKPGTYSVTPGSYRVFSRTRQCTRAWAAAAGIEEGAAAQQSRQDARSLPELLLPPELALAEHKGLTAAGKQSSAVERTPAIMTCPTSG